MKGTYHSARGLVLQRCLDERLEGSRHVLKLLGEDLAEPVSLELGERLLVCG
jgi:hypothetical protein